MTTNDAHPGEDPLTRLMGNAGFQNEVAQIRAHAALAELPGEEASVNWTYNIQRVLRNATAALLDLERASPDNRAAQSSALRIGQLWESISKLSHGSQRLYAQLNSMLAYEIASYQANSICIARTVAAGKEVHDDPLLPIVTMFFRRQFFQALGSTSYLLQHPPEASLDAAGTISLAAKALTVTGIQEAARYFVTGDQARISRSADLLILASEGFVSIGAVFEHFLVRLLSQAIPRMVSRSTWTLLEPIHDANMLWKRYLQLLARGLGPRIDTNSGIVELWPSQITAVSSGLLVQNQSSLVLMPTSAGKTRIAEMAIVSQLLMNPNRKCIYIAPFRALAAEIESSLSGLFADLGLTVSTTLGSFETDAAELELLDLADIIITTPEKLDMLLRTNREFFEAVVLIVLDEGQLIEDGSRGIKYELLITRIKRSWPNIRFISLSAVIPSSTLNDFADWLSTDRSSIQESTWRPAIQRHAIFRWGTTGGFINFLPDPEAPGIQRFLPNVIQSQQFAVVNPATAKISKKRFPDRSTKAQTAAELAYNLVESGPVLIFCTTPTNANSVAEWLMTRINYTKSSDSLVAHAFLPRQTRSSEISAEWLGESHPLTDKLRNGIAVHHGDIPDAVCRAIEKDFRSKQYQVIVATSTLAQGVNLPVKTVIMHSAARYDGQRMRDISAREYWNVAGRAGRAGEETESMIIHICHNDQDRRNASRYAASRHNLEPVTSALLNYLTTLIAERITDEEYLAILDADLLALLVEENVQQVTEEWISDVLGDTLAGTQIVANLPLKTMISQQIERSSQRILSSVPDQAVRKAYSSTGLSVYSCDSLATHIRENEEELRRLLTSEDISDRNTLLHLMLSGCLLAQEMQPVAEPVFDTQDLASAWISGERYEVLRQRFLGIDMMPESLSEYVEEGFGYRLPWGLAAYLRLAVVLLSMEESELASQARYLPAMLKYGVPSPAAVWAMTLGLSYRQAAIRIGQAFMSAEDRPTFRQFRDWASRWDPESLNEVFGFSGQQLQDIYVSLHSSRPSPLIKQELSSDGRSYPITGEVFVGATSALQLSKTLEVGNIVTFKRDYDSVVNRNAVEAYFGSEYLGALHQDVSQLIAPDIDAGVEFQGAIEGISYEGLITRLFVNVLPISNE